MPNWIPITKANLYDAQIAALIDACDTAALGNGQAARSPGIIQGVVDEIRRKVASWPRNQLDVDVTAIPAGLKSHAVTLITAKLKIAISQELSDDERSEVTTANKNLDRVAAGTDVVEQPDNPLPSFEEMQIGTAVTHKAGERKASAKKMNGLI